MTLNEMILLIADLCARLPYATMVRVENDSAHTEPLELLGVDISKGIVKLGETIDGTCFVHRERIGKVKPYLRLMSSMTEEERKIWHEKEYDGYIGDDVDYLNSIHIDYRDMIADGLALPATDDMYNTKND